MEENCEKFFLTLSNKLKISIVESLRGSEKSVSELSGDIGEERSKVSHALQDLLRCSLVEVRREGRKRVYSLNEDTIEPLLDLVDEHVEKYCAECEW
ncbi:MAG: ArsR/SmtB family transcription factor [Candidatus Aenigmatarchaeota archaeon]